MTMSRSDAAKIAAHTRWAHETDRGRTARAGYEGLLARLAREVDPDGTLPEAERDKRVRNALAAHMIRVRAARKSRRTTTTRT